MYRWSKSYRHGEREENEVYVRFALSETWRVDPKNKERLLLTHHIGARVEIAVDRKCDPSKSEEVCAEMAKELGDALKRAGVWS